MNLATKHTDWLRLSWGPKRPTATDRRSVDRLIKLEGQKKVSVQHQKRGKEKGRGAGYDLVTGAGVMSRRWTDKEMRCVPFSTIPRLFARMDVQ